MQSHPRTCNYRQRHMVLDGLLPPYEVNKKYMPQ
jgi:hypothetical protein